MAKCLSMCDSLISGRQQEVAGSTGRAYPISVDDDAAAAAVEGLRGKAASGQTVHISPRTTHTHTRQHAPKAIVNTPSSRSGDLYG